MRPAHAAAAAAVAGRWCCQGAQLVGRAYGCAEPKALTGDSWCNISRVCNSPNSSSTSLPGGGKEAGQRACFAAVAGAVRLLVLLQRRLLHSWFVLLQLGPALKGGRHLQHHLLPLCLVLPVAACRAVRLLLLLDWAAADAEAAGHCLCCWRGAGRACCCLRAERPAAERAACAGRIARDVTACSHCWAAAASCCPSSNCS